MTTEREPTTPTPAQARKPRASKGSLRTAAWAAAGASLAAPFVALNAQPKPVPPDAAKARQVIIVHRTIRRVVIDPPAQVAAPAAAAAAPSVRYVYVGGGTVTTGGGTSGTTRCSGC
ncbi:MAG TPA: hypothetical protein VNN79_24620 [Actinomycetota bacterium]|nr:hypothetical protein [Actinomycetota bacterium]